MSQPPPLQVPARPPAGPGFGRRTRLAPSPTGALHLGNARTFLLTWALARRAGWSIILRIEDLDTPRVKSGSIAALLETLRWLGMDWDGLPGGDHLAQSRDLEPYRRAIRALAATGKAYPCGLTRTQIEAAASAPQEGSHDTVYPAALRPPLRPFDFDIEESRAGAEGTNWRLVVPEGAIEFHDRFAGSQAFDVSSVVGDFVLWTKRGLPSYQLAVVVDDHRQGVTDVIRGDDLLDSAARQMLLYRALGYDRANGAGIPEYTHLPLVLGPDGRRLAKRHGDTRVDHYRDRGVPAEAVIGLVAYWSGMLAARNRLSARDFLAATDLATLPRHAITFTAEDDRWLLNQAR